AKKGAHEPFLEMLRENPLALGAAEKALKRLGEEGPWYAKEALRRLADAAAVYALGRVAKDPFPELARLYALRFLHGESLPQSARKPALYDPW
ncbi:MAG: acyl-CoA dehydrogenase family protein, partial [Thermus sp.]